MRAQYNPETASFGTTKINTMSAPCAPAPQPEPDTIVNSIANQLHSRLGHLHSLNARLESLADRLLGGAGTNGDTGSISPPAPGQLGNLQAAIPFTDYLLDQLGTQVKPLELL